MGMGRNDQHDTTGATDHEPSFNGRWNIVGKIIVDVFKEIFPFTFLLTVITKCTSEALVAQNLAALEEGEFLQYLRIWALMVTTSGYAKKDFWDPLPHNQ